MSKPILYIKESHGPVNQMEIYDNTLYCCHKGRSIRLYDLKSKEKIRSLKGHANLVRSISANDDYLASVSRDSTLRLWVRNRIP